MNCKKYNGNKLLTYASENHEIAEVQYKTCTSGQMCADYLLHWAF